QVGRFRERALDLPAPLRDALLEPDEWQDVADRGGDRADERRRHEVGDRKREDEADREARDRQQGRQAVAKSLESRWGQRCRIAGLAELLANLDRGPRGEGGGGSHQ